MCRYDALVNCTSRCPVSCVLNRCIKVLALALPQERNQQECGPDFLFLKQVLSLELPNLCESRHIPLAGLGPKTPRPPDGLTEV